ELDAASGRWYDVFACRVGPPERREVGVFLREITDRKSIEFALRESEERFRLLVESVAQAVWEAEPDGTVHGDAASWRAYTGQTLDEVQGSGWLDAVHPDDRAFAQARWQHALSTGMRLNAEFRLRRAGGGWRWTNVQAAPVLGPDGAVRKWVGMNIDITARKRAERQLAETAAALREADRHKDEFLATLAHELRNPLAPIRNGLDILGLTIRGNAGAERT